MRRDRLILLGLVIVPAVLALIVGLWLVPRRGVSQANFDRLQVGWTEAQVRAILGDPAHERRYDEDVDAGADVVRKIWVEDSLAIAIVFRDGRVVWKGIGRAGTANVPLPFRERLRRRLPWLPF